MFIIFVDCLILLMNVYYVHGLSCFYRTSAMSNEKIDKRGYAYECLVCKQYKVEKRYVEAHIYKKHLHPTGAHFTVNYVIL